MRDVFISHSRSPEDVEFAKQLASELARAIESEDLGLRTFLDEHDISAGENFASEIGKALENSVFMLLLLSPAALRSSWVRRELEYALGEPKFEGRLIPILIRRVARAEVPWVLRNVETIKWLDATKGPEKDPAKLARRLVRLFRSAPEVTPR